MNVLPNDVCRCYGLNCPERQRCLRFKGADDRGEYIAFHPALCAADDTFKTFNTDYPYKIVDYAYSSGCKGD